MIRSTRHHLKDLNVGKNSRYLDFVEEYSRVVRSMVDKIWEELPEDLTVPKYFDYNAFGVDTPLSARALSSAATQASGLVRAGIEKQRRRLWVRANKNSEVRDVKIAKPKLGFVAPQLSSKCCDIHRSSDSRFWGYVRLRSIGRDYGEIILPIIRHPRVAGDMPKAGVVFFKNAVQLAWEVLKSPSPKGDRVLGFDQGYKAVATLSDGQVTPSACPHGHSLESIITRLSRRKKGSRGFRRAQAHRKNFVNWSINQLDLSNAKEVRVEKVVNIRKGVSASRSMSHWSNPEIRDKILRRCEELEVPVLQQSCAYRSQRCNRCGLVRKANRNAKHYECRACGYTCDADLNAAKNHECDLPPIPFALLGQRLNLGPGFLWKPEGLFTVCGAEIRVPRSQY